MRWFIGIAVGLFTIFTITFLLAEQFGWTESRFIIGHLTALRDSSDNGGLVGAAIFLLLAGDLVLPVPSSIVMTLSGFFLGTLAGTVVAFSGAMTSALVGFGLCRRFGQTAFNRLAGHDTTRVQHLLDRYGAWAIIFSRSVPMLTEVMSCLAGLSRMPFRRFLALSAAGTLPICIVYAWAGSRSQQTPTGIGWAIVLAFVIPALGLGCVRLMSAKSQAARPSPPHPHV